MFIRDERNLVHDHRDRTHGNTARSTMHPQDSLE